MTRAGEGRREELITNGQDRTHVDEIARSVYRISTPVDVVPGVFTFNQ